MFRHLFTLLCLLCSVAFFCRANESDKLHIASLHPLLGDMARQIGGDRVVVIDLLKPNGNLHTFEPSPKDVAAAGKATLMLASGKNLEPYLTRLKEALGASVTVLELGANVPDVAIAVDSADTHHHHHHGGGSCSHCCHHGPNDPHWWHTPANMKIAARTLTTKLIELLPAHQNQFRQSLFRWNRTMDQLSAWARTELNLIPTHKRILVTGHAAMNHFCKEFGFRSISVQGISKEDEGHAAQLANILKKLRAAEVRAVFPEYSASPKSLEEIAKSLHIPLAEPLNTDGLSPSETDFATMFRKNVGIIRKALSSSND